MKLIAHRANLNGKSSNTENHPAAIKNVLNLGLDCEIDVWSINNSWFLGHDNPTYSIDYNFLLLKGLWVHCKNIQALSILSEKSTIINYFWHQNDDYTLTSKGYIWTFPDKPVIGTNSIAVMPEIWKKEYTIPNEIYGVCTDYPIGYLHLL